MRITKLSLTNFRSFKETQTIEFAPVTLLFGPNSVGKSSVLMSIFYLHQILEQGNCNPVRLSALNNKYVGGFENLVHGRKLDNPMIIKIAFDKQGKVGSSYGFLSDLIEGAELCISSPSVSAETMALEFELAWSSVHKTAYVSRYTVFFDDIFIAEVTSDAGLKQPVISSINYLHPLLMPENHEEWLLSSFEDGASIHWALYDKLFDYLDLPNPTHREISKGASLPFEDYEEPPEFSYEPYVSELHEQLNEGRFQASEIDDAANYGLIGGNKVMHVPIGVDSISGALLRKGSKLKTSLSLDDMKLSELLTELLSDLLIAPLDNLCRILDDSLCIGPLRVIPDEMHQINTDVNQADWYNGRAAWDLLAQNDFKVLSAVNSWLISESKLNLGVEFTLQAQITYSVRETITSGSSFQEVHQRLVNEGVKPSEGRFANFDKVDWSWSNSLWDPKNKMTISPSELGVGVSQIMPVVVAALSRSQGLVAVEQPELHIHPRVQVGIGDLFTQIKNGPNFLVETHSEHLILRLLRRVRQTSNNELPDGLNPVLNTDICILYLDPSIDGVQVKKIEVDEDGEFLVKWPKGFFAERREELM
ncbi:AAA domain protein [Vibrio cholerae]|nr:AAA domain protein [Vibrio cholerae]